MCKVQNNKLPLSQITEVVEEEYRKHPEWKAADDLYAMQSRTVKRKINDMVGNELHMKDLDITAWYAGLSVEERGIADGINEYALRAAIGKISTDDRIDVKEISLRAVLDCLNDPSMYLSSDPHIFIDLVNQDE